MDPWQKDVIARLTRIEHNQHRIMRELLAIKGDVEMAYEQELDAAEAAAKANNDIDDSVEQILLKVTDLIAALKTQQTDPATAKRITDLAAAVKGRAERLGTAAANVPTA
jgi:signal transduction histidine kinase